MHGESMILVGVQDSFRSAQPMVFLACAQNVRPLIGRGMGLRVVSSVRRNLPVSASLTPAHDGQ
jgi:hypothetical protein